MLGLVFEATNPPLTDDAIISWQWILTLQGASPDARTLAQEHLKALTGKVPTQLPTYTSSPTAPVTPSATFTATSPAGPTNTPLPSVTPTPGPSPTPSPEPIPEGH
jgi:hypothetical protein